MGETNMVYQRHKWVTFLSMYCAYTLTVLNRKSFSFTLPAIMQEGKLDKNDIGLIASSQNLGYTISKFLAGLMSDSINSRVFLASGLFCSGLVTVLFTGFENASIFAVLWFLQGMCQGAIWPACAKILRQWSTPEAFGTLWSVLSTSMNVAAFVGPLLVSVVATNTSWRVAVCLLASVWGFPALQPIQHSTERPIYTKWLAANKFGQGFASLNRTMNVACCLGPLLLAYLLFLTDFQWRPCLQALGTGAIVVALGCSVTISNSPAEVGFENEDKKGEDKGRKGRGRGTWQDLLHSPLMGVLFASYMVVFMTRTAALDWGQLLLIQERGQSPLMGSAFISSLELGGVIGSVVAGYTADQLVAVSKRENTKGTPRMFVAMAFILLTVICLHLLVFVIAETSSQVFISVVAFLLGFGIYGPVALYGVMAIESAPTHLSGTSHAIVGLAANVGAVLAGLPLSYVAKYFDWSGAFLVLEILLIGILGVKMATRNLDYKMISIKKKLQ